jgi:hypothetical protein
MSVPVAKSKEFSIDTFIDLFIMALVLRGKQEIYIRSDRAIDERRRMRALHAHLSALTAADTQENISWSYFIVRLRNKLSPGNNDSFDEFYHEFRCRQSWLTSIDLPECIYFRLDIQAITSKSYLEQADPEFRAFVVTCANVYMAPVKKER